MNRETFAAYLLDLQDVPAKVLEQVCRELGRAPRAEYETPWPSLGTIRERCAIVVRLERDRAESRRLLSPPPGNPITPEQWEDIKARFKAVLEKR